MKNPSSSNREAGLPAVEKNSFHQHLQKYQQHLDRACKLAKLGWWEWNIRGEQIDVSDELYEIYGITKKDYPVFSSGIYLSFVHPEDLESVLKNVSIFWQASSHEYQHRITRPSGEIVYVALNVQTVKDDKNNIIEVHGTIKDITEQIKSEEAFFEAKKKFEDIIECTGDGFYAIDKDWNITYWNKKAETITGTKREELLGKNIREVYPSSGIFFKKFEKALSMNRAEHFQEFSSVYSVYLDVSAYPSPDGLTVYIRDITEKKKQAEERKRTEEKLKETGEELLNILENMPDAFCTLDKNWYFTYINNRLATMVGGTREEFIGKNLWDCFPEATKTKFYPSYNKALKEQISVTVEEFYAPLNIWLEVNVHPTRDGLCLFIKDVSERKQQEQRLEFISKATSELIWEYTFETDEFVFDVERVEQLFGYILQNRSVPLSYWFDKIPMEDIEAVLSNRQYAIEHNYNFYLTEYRLKKADGNQAYIRDRVLVVRNNNGKAVSLIGAMEDITMEKLSEKALMESMESYRQLFNTSPLATVIFDPWSLHIYEINSALVEQYGYSRQELATMTILDMHAEEHHQKVIELLNVLRPNVRNDLGLIEHVRKNGQRILVEVSATSILYKNKPAILATANDVTEKNALQKQMIEEKVNYQKHITKATLEAQEKERTEIARELHDNVNQILAAAKLNVANTLHYPEHSSHFIIKGTDLLQNAIDEIRKLSRALTSPTLRGFSFEESLHELLASYKDLQLLKINHRFDFNGTVLDTGLCLSVYRILQEQINNTIKYSKASGIWVAITITETSLELHYEDDGIGFDPGSVKKGLGLNNIQYRTDAYNGKLEIITSKNKGFAMHISFPL